MVFQKYYKKLIFNIINIINYDIVLGILWLKKYNSQINWKKEILIMECKYMFDSESYYQFNIIKDKKRSYKW